MNKTILVSLISAQTIPNLQLIKEKQSEVDAYIFLTTKTMEKKNVSAWLRNAANIDESILQIIEINPFSFEDIESKLLKVDLDESNKYILNITGGTKLMSIATYEFFKDLLCEVYYVTGYNKEFIKVHPGRKKPLLRFKESIELKEYLKAYGFEVQGDNLSKPYLSEDYAYHFMELFPNLDEHDLSIIDRLRSERSKTNIDISSISGLSEFLSKIEYPKEKIKRLTDKQKITKYDARYLSGDWLEEYTFYKLCNELHLADSAVGLGINITKSDVQNEFDVLFIHNDKLYTVECKTSIYDHKGKPFIKDVIYKSDSLRNNLGLFAETAVLTVSSVKDDKGEFKKGIEPHYKRAKDLGIRMIAISDLRSSNTLKSLLGIK